jgi:hypothetical protein
MTVTTKPKKKKPKIPETAAVIEVITDTEDICDTCESYPCSCVADEVSASELFEEDGKDVEKSKKTVKFGENEETTIQELDEAMSNGLESVVDSMDDEDIENAIEKSL